MIEDRMKMASICVAIIASAGIGMAEVHVATSAAMGPHTKWVKGNTTFAADLYGQPMKCDGNLFFSPYSISTALPMTYAGARKDTATQMAATMHFSLDPRSERVILVGRTKHEPSTNDAGRSNYG